MEKVNCILCDSDKYGVLFTKASGNGENFNLVKCKGCGLNFISPRPDYNEIKKYYGINYFSTRTERGYNNYFSKDVENEISRVFQLNLSDLGFYEFEKMLAGKKRSLDIGCAAGYFVNYMKNRNWLSGGIEMSRDCVNAAVENDLDVKQGDYLITEYKEKFNLITLWATIEHLHNPEKFLQKIYKELDDNGRLYISTCRSGGLNFMRFFGVKWRYYNFPEHLYFFSFKLLKRLLSKNGFEIDNYFTYGSGMGSGGSMLRKISDFSAKKFYFGDMMVISAHKK